MATNERHPRKNKEVKEPIEIRFGDVFEIDKNYSPVPKWVIVGFGIDPRYFHAAGIIEDDGVEKLSIFGTTERRQIERVVDHWDLQKVIEAFKEGFGKYIGEETRKRALHDFELAVQEGVRVVK